MLLYHTFSRAAMGRVALVPDHVRAATPFEALNRMIEIGRIALHFATDGNRIAVTHPGTGNPIRLNVSPRALIAALNGETMKHPPVEAVTGHALTARLSRLASRYRLEDEAEALEMTVALGTELAWYVDRAGCLEHRDVATGERWVQDVVPSARRAHFRPATPA